MAAELNRHGLAVRIIDKNTERTTLSKALAVWPRTLELMEQLGCVEQLLAAGNQCHGANVYANKKKLAHVSLDYMQSHFKFGLLISQCQTERVLLEFLESKGIRVERQVELIGFVQDAHEVRSRLRHADGTEETVVTPWLAGCDGAHSTVRHTLGLQFEGETSPTHWVLADVQTENSVWPEDEICAFMDETGAMAVFPFREQDGALRYRLICDAGESHAEGPRPEPTLALVQGFVDRRCPVSAKLANPHWLANFSINERKVKEYRQGRCFLAGDAAHVHSPFGGQGMNTGMQDACNLAWKLAEVTLGRAKESILETYSPERSAVGDAVLKNAGRMTAFATLRNPVAQAIRNKVYGFLGNLELVQRKANQVLGELDIHYPFSELSQEHGGAHAWILGSGVHAGDRLPDGELTQPDGTIKRLQALLHDPKWNLLLLEGLEGPGSLDLDALGRTVVERYPGVDFHVIGSASDPQGVVRKALGAAHSAVYLVRPDGYVGYRGQPIEEAPLLTYLERFLIPTSVAAR